MWHLRSHSNLHTYCTIHPYFNPIHCPASRHTHLSPVNNCTPAGRTTAKMDKLCTGDGYGTNAEGESSTPQSHSGRAVLDPSPSLTALFTFVHSNNSRNSTLEESQHRPRATVHEPCHQLPLPSVC